MNNKLKTIKIILAIATVFASTLVSTQTANSTPTLTGVLNFRAGSSNRMIFNNSIRFLRYWLNGITGNSGRNTPQNTRSSGRSIFSLSSYRHIMLPSSNNNSLPSDTDPSVNLLSVKSTTYTSSVSVRRNSTNLPRNTQNANNNSNTASVNDK